MSSVDLENANERDVMTIPEAAKRLGVCPKLLRRARDERKLPVYRIGSQWDRVIWSEVLTWLRGHRTRPSNAAEYDARDEERVRLHATHDLLRMARDDLELVVETWEEEKVGDGLLTRRELVEDALAMLREAKVPTLHRPGMRPGDRRT